MHYLHRRICPLLLGLPLILPAQAEPVRPSYQNLRYQENWEALKSQAPQDLFDPLKFIPFNEEGNIYLSLGGSLRLRGEAWDNFGFQDDNDAVFGLSQIRLHSDFHLYDYLRLFVEGKSALSTARNLPGGNRTIDVDSLALQNAFVDLKLPFAADSHLLLRTGRQEVDFGKERLLSSLRWVNSRRNFDGFRLQGKLGPIEASGFYTQLVKVDTTAFNTSSPNTSTYGLYATAPSWLPTLKHDFYWIGLHKAEAKFESVSGEENRQTLGSRFFGKLPFDLDLDLEGAYQFGTLSDQSITAFFTASEVGYSLDFMFKPRFALGFDYASGDQSAKDQSLNTFNQLFPLAHAYYGLADILGRQNAIDFKATVAITPAPKFKVKLDGHSFYRASTSDGVYGVSGALFHPGSTLSGGHIGSEIDLTLKYAFDRHTNVMGGYSYFLPGAFLNAEKSNTNVHFGYLQTQYQF